MLQPLDTNDHVERIIVVGKPRIQIPRADLNTVQLKYLWVKIAARNIIAQPRQPQRKSSLARRNVEQRTAVTVPENVLDGVVYRDVCNSFWFGHKPIKKRSTPSLPYRSSRLSAQKQANLLAKSQ